MNPSRKLDALIAEKVMGCRVWTSIGGSFACGCAKTTLGPHDDPKLDPKGYDVIKAYSTDIAAAWEVVEHLTSRDLYPEIKYSSGKYWLCEIISGGEIIGQAEKYSASHAICLAALGVYSYEH